MPLVEERRNARIDQIAKPFEAGHVRSREPEAAGPVGHGRAADRRFDGRRERFQLLFELRAREHAGIRVPLHVVRRARRCFPRVMVGPDLAVSRSEQATEHVRRSPVGRNRMGDDIRRPDAVTGKQRVEPGEGVDVLESLVRAGRRIPLVVPFGVDPDEQVHLMCGAHEGGHRSWSESPSVTCHRSVPS